MVFEAEEAKLGTSRVLGCLRLKPGVNPDIPGLKIILSGLSHPVSERWRN